MTKAKPQQEDNECPSCGFKYDGVLSWHNMNGECELMNNTKVQPLIEKIKPQQESWVDRFRKQFREEPDKDNEEMYFEFYNGCVEFRKGYQGYDSFMIDLEAFISTQRTQILNEVRELVEGMRLETHETEALRKQLYGYNQALDDLLQAIEKLKEEHE